MISSASARLLPLERMSNTSRREVSKGSSTDNECQTPGKSLLTNLKSSRGRKKCASFSAHNEGLSVCFCVLL